MPSPRQMVIASLKHLARQCLREEASLVTLRSIQRAIDRDREAVRRDQLATRARVRLLKRRIDRELILNADLLGVPTDLTE